MGQTIKLEVFLLLLEIIYFQPVSVLRAKSDLKKIFLHEFLHFWISKIGNLPDFINEGISLYYSQLFNKNATFIFPEGLELKEIT